jgi:hypothetical protein
MQGIRELPMANIFADPFNSTLGAGVAGMAGALSGATWAASELAKLGRKIGGAPGEISGALLGASTGAMGGLLVGSIIGALARDGVVTYYLGSPLKTSLNPDVCCPPDSTDHLREDSQ